MFQALRIYLNDDEKADKYLDFIKGSESIVKNLNNSISDKVFSPRGIQIVDSITDAIEIHKRRHTRYNFLKFHLVIIFELVSHLPKHDFHHFFYKTCLLVF